MTIDCERKRAVEMAYDFLGRLMDPSQTKRVPSEIRQEARRVLRHYPHSI